MISFSTGLSTKMSAIENTMKKLFDEGELHLFSSPRPDTADLCETGAPLAILKLDGTNGLLWEGPKREDIVKPKDDQWFGNGLINGHADWFRVYDKNIKTGASTTAVRFDGDCGTYKELPLPLDNIEKGVRVYAETLSAIFM